MNHQQESISLKAKPLPCPAQFAKTHIRSGMFLSHAANGTEWDVSRRQSPVYRDKGTRNKNGGGCYSTTHPPHLP